MDTLEVLSHLESQKKYFNELEPSYENKSSCLLKFRIAVGFIIGLQIILQITNEFARDHTGISLI